MSVVTLLVERGADVNAADRLERTPLHGIVGGFRTARFECARVLLESGAAIAADIRLPLATAAVAGRSRDLVFHLLWRSVDVPGRMDEPRNEEQAAAQRAIEFMLAQWSRGGLRAWHRDAHFAFVAAFRTDVASLLLATLGSLEEGADDAAGAGAASRSALWRNPLRMLRHEGQGELLELVFQSLLIAHMGGPAAPPRAAA